ncbi:MAG: DUF2218 domain-containing protein [Steroidobacteraceae bacterium]
MPNVIAEVSIPTPARYMVRLAKHFEHRVAVERTETSATVNFPDGVCTMAAGDALLTLRIEASDESNLSRYQEVVARHLKQVAPQETVEVVWKPAG